MNSLVSVIVACYNHAQYLNEAIDSLLAQTYQNWECIIINDGSTDNTEQVALQIVERDSRIRYYQIDNSGVSFARNFGIGKSKGYYILPFDADDRIHASYLEKAVKAFSTTDVKIVYCDIELFGAKKGLFTLPEYSPKGLATMNMILGNSMFRRDDFDAAGGYNINMIYGWEDWNLWISFLKNGGSVYKIPETLFYYRIQKDSRTKGLAGAKMQKTYMQLYLNHPDFFDHYYSQPIEIFPQYKDMLEKVSFLKGLWLLKPSSYLSLIKKIQNRLQK